MLIRYTQMEPHCWIAFRLVHGPVMIGGLVLRGIEADDNRGGRLRAVERWCCGRWCCLYDGPGWRDVLGAPLASDQALRSAVVGAEPFPVGYEPLTTCAHPPRL